MRKKRSQTYRKGQWKPLHSHVRKLAVTTVCLAMIAGCQQMDTLMGVETPPASGQEQLKLVNTEKIKRQKIGDIPEVAGDVMSSVQAEIMTVTGGTVEQIYKKRGETVTKGELIFRLSSPNLKMQRERAALAVREAQDAIEQAKRLDAETQVGYANNLLKQEVELDKLTRQYNRIRNSYDAGIATKAELEQAKTNLQNHKLDMELAKQKKATADSRSLNSLEVQLRNAELTLQQAEEALGALEVRAPISGVLAELDLEAGIRLQPEVKVGHILFLDRLKIKASLGEEAARQVAGRKELTYYLPGETNKYRGRITYLASFFNPQTKGYELNIEVDNANGHLKPGTKVRLQLADEAEQFVLTVPTFSVVKEGDQSFVYILKGNIAEKRKVTLGRINEPNQEVLSGVKEDETLIITGHTQLSDQEKVRTVVPDGNK